MRLVCPECSSQYEVDGTLFPNEGREVQCAQCEHQWVQYPISDPEPVRLTTQVAPPPSAQMSSNDRTAFQSAVSDELAAQDDFGNGETEEADMMRSLREQLAEDADDFDYDEKNASDSTTGRRSVSAAAENAGISIDSEVEERRAHREPEPSDLAAALKEYERERGPRRGGRAGFITAILLCLIAVGAYVGRVEIAKRYPPAVPYLEQYVSVVDMSRDKVGVLFGSAAEFVTEKMMEMTAPEGADAATTTE